MCEFVFKELQLFCYNLLRQLESSIAKRDLIQNIVL